MDNSNNSIGSMPERQNVIQYLNVACTPVTVTSFFFFFSENNERASVALFSSSGVGAGQRGEAARLNAQSKTHKKQGAWAISYLGKG